MRLVFFDFNLNYGGGAQGSIYLARRLNFFNEVHIVDAYGQCREYINAVRSAGLRLHILKPSGGKTYIGQSGIKRLASFLQWLPEMMELRRKTVRLLKFINPDVIWINNEKSLVLLTSSPYLLYCPKAIYLRGWSTADQVSPFLRWLMRTSVAAVIVHASAAEKELINAGIPKRKLYCVQNCIDVSHLKTEAVKGPKGFLPGMNKRPRMLLPAARLVREKGQATAIRATLRLKDDGLDPTLWLTGVTSVGVNNDYENELKKMILKNGLAENIHLLGWRKDIPFLINACDIVILPSYTEGFPRVILEAMHLKKPICSTPVGGVREAIIDGKTGFLFDIEDDAKLSEKIKILTEKKVKDEIVSNSHKLILNNFIADLHTKRIHQIFESIRRK